MRRHRTYFITLALILTFTFQFPINMAAEKSLYQTRMSLYKKTEALTQIPWYYIAAIDQYERNKEKDSSNEQVVSISIPNELWYGLGNNTKHNDLDSIALA